MVEQSQVTEVWQDFWAAHGDLLNPSLPPPQYLVDALSAAIAPVHPVRILEAGSGTGGLSRALTGLGAEVAVIDIVPRCIEMTTKANSADNHVSGAVADLFRLPYPDQTFDAVFNSGVMEHFEDGLLRTGLIEMARVVRPGGRLICVTPSARGRFYTFGKRQMERRKEWPFGVEHPQRSLASHLNGQGLRLISEYQVGAVHQLWFLQGLIGRIVRRSLSRLENETNPLALRLVGGYLLVSVWERSGPSRSL